MKCGVAAGDFTPSPGLTLQGHWNTNPSRSVLYPLEVRAAVFEEGETRAAIATLDVIGITKEMTDRIRERVEAACGIPGEPVLEIGLAIEKQLWGKLDAEDIWPVGYANDEIGYLCTERQHLEGGYEPNAFPYYGEPAPFRGEERAIVETAESLVRG